jgi:hypothetical protein
MSCRACAAHSDDRDADGLHHRTPGKAAIVRVIDQDLAFAGKFIAHLLAQAVRVEADPAFGVSGIIICVGSGTRGHGGICCAFAVRQCPRRLRQRAYKR